VLKLLARHDAVRLVSHPRNHPLHRGAFWSHHDQK
jgi:hypothetical protein